MSHLQVSSAGLLARVSGKCVMGITLNQCDKLSTVGNQCDKLSTVGIMA